MKFVLNEVIKNINFVKNFILKMLFNFNYPKKKVHLNIYD